MSRHYDEESQHGAYEYGSSVAGPSRHTVPVHRLPLAHSMINPDGGIHSPTHPPTISTGSEIQMLNQELGERQHGNPEKAPADITQGHGVGDAHHDHEEPRDITDALEIEPPKWWAPYVNALMLTILTGVCIWATVMGIIYWVGMVEENERLFKLDDERCKNESHFDLITTTMTVHVQSHHSSPLMGFLSPRDVLEPKADGIESCGAGSQSCSAQGHPELCCSAGLACKTFDSGPSGVYCCSPSTADSDHKCVPPGARIRTECPTDMFRCEPEEEGGSCARGTACTKDRYAQIADADAAGLESRPTPPGFVRPDPSKRTLAARKFAAVAPNLPPSSPSAPLERPVVPIAEPTIPTPRPTLDSTTASLPPVPPALETSPTIESTSAPIVEAPATEEFASETQSQPETESTANPASTVEPTTTSRPGWHESASSKVSYDSSLSRVAISGLAIVAVLLITI
ncbi:hypothetical protein MKZ38_009966 [Zalerion maritima]|uniref:Uncharacterized protein n=1 Tax=Zalerion maritima TaxID=339359 RepID=A0AAD5WUF2_9PEZI|nr:hypothetical protein MKZ38_009966 [Zalerion maritima]